MITSTHVWFFGIWIMLIATFWFLFVAYLRWKVLTRKREYRLGDGAIAGADWPYHRDIDAEEAKAERIGRSRVDHRGYKTA
ncbi:MAG: hypothetical protein QXT26_05555 [Thermoproteota archaeon]